MIKNYLSMLAILFIWEVAAQDTFSIVAADSSSREVGGAGASCVDLTNFGLKADFLSDLIPNKGAINTQSYYDANNQINARNRMLAGDSPSQIINWLVDNDKGFDPTIRQYGIVGFTNTATEAAAYTGSNCLDVKYHKTGKKNGFTYSIQGNILIGAQVIDSMEARFNATSGDLRCKLMAALQGAKIVGADSRCEPLGTSSLFSFLKVSKPSDAYGKPYFSIGVIGSEANAFEPIDSLQKLFNQVVNCGTTSTTSLENSGVKLTPNPFSDELHIELADAKPWHFQFMNTVGQRISSGTIQQSTTIDTKGMQAGFCCIILTNGSQTVTQKLVKQ